MAGRSVTAILSANVSGYIAAMNRAAQATQQFATRSSAAVSKNKEGINRLSRDAGLIGLAAAAGVGTAVKSFAEFDAAMSGVAATGSDARNNISALRDAAIQAGAATKYSATEAAGGVEALAKAGVSSADILGGGLKGALNLAAAGNLSVSDSADAAASAMNQFGLRGKDVTHIADLYAQVAGVAQGNTSDVAEAMKFAGVAASTYGVNIDTTAESLAVLARNGITGSLAGTTLRGSLTNLYAPTAKVQKVLDSLGVSAYDAATHQVRPLGAVLDELQQKTSGLDASTRNFDLARIFGKENLPGAIALVKAGSAGLADMGVQFGQFGTAADVAATKMNNLKGDLEQLRGSFETALIGLGSGADGPLRSLVEGATNAVNAFNNLGSGSKSAILAIGAGIAVIALSAGGIGKVVVAANEAKVALAGLGISAKTASLATGAIGLGITIGAAAFASYAKSAAESRARVDDLTQALQASNGVLDQNIAQTRAKSLSDSGALADANSLGISIADVTQASLGNTSAQARVNAELAKYSTGAKNAQSVARGLGTQVNSTGQATLFQAEAAKRVSTAIGQGNTELAAGVQKYKDLSTATNAANQQFGNTAGSTSAAAAAFDRASTALGSIQSTASGASQSLSDLANSLFAVSDAALATSNAQVGFEQAIDAAAASAKKNGNNLKLSSAAGRENQTALNNLAASSQKYVQSLVEQGKNSKTVEAATKDARSAFIDNAHAMGVSIPKAKALADQYGLIPKKVRTDVEANTGNSKQKLAEVNAAVKGLPKDVQTQVRSAYRKGGIEAAKAKLAELKDKIVTAGTRADTKGAKTTQQVIDSLKGKTVTAGTRDDSSGAKSAQRAVNSVRGKTVTVKVAADTSGASEARQAIATVNGKTVTVTIRRHTVSADGGTATGGLITPYGPMFRGPLRRSRGGPVWGAGSATSDSIPALLSNGEFVIRAAAVKTIGVNVLARMNSKGYAAGGLVGRYATGGLATSDVYALIRALQNPLHDIAAAAATLASERGKIGKPTARLAKATKAYESARDRQETVRDRVNRLAKEAAATKGITKADRELKKARLELAVANARVTKTSREKTAATKAYNDVAGPTKDATEALVAAQKALADSARTVSDSFSEQYRSTSTDASDWIDLMRTGATDLTAFTQKIATLRKSGLSETLVQQIIGMGATAGSEIATQIAAGGKGLVDSLDQANASLQTAADSLGYLSATGQKRYAAGGLVVGRGTGTSDSVPALLSNGEWVVPASAVPANRVALEAMTSGRQVVEHRQVRTSYLGGAMVQAARSNIDADTVRQALAGASFYVQNPIDGAYFRAFVRTEAAGVVATETGKARTSF